MVTFSDLLTQIRQRANNEGNTNFSDDELTSYLKLSLAELYGLMTDSNEDWNITRFTFTIPGNQSNADGYRLPTDFWKVIRVDRSLGSTNYVTLTRINLRDENLFITGASSFFVSPVMGYTTEVNDGYTYLRVYPQTNKGGDYRILYYPALKDYQLTDEIKIGPPGQHWEEYAILESCIKCCMKDGNDYTGFMNQKAMMTQRIKGEASTRDESQTDPPPQTGPAWYDRGSFSGGWY